MCIRDRNDPAFDLNGDGIVDLADRDAWLAEAGNVNIGPGRAYLLGDANLDGRVDISDFNVWNSNKFTSGVYWCNGNFNGDTFVDVTDFNLFNDNRFTFSDEIAAFVSEPFEPTSEATDEVERAARNELKFL